MKLGIRPNKVTTVPSNREKRLVVRVDLSVFVYPLRGGQPMAGRAVNLSTGGMFVASRDQVLEGESVRLVITASSHLPNGLELEGWVAHVSEHGMGVQFSDDSAASQGMLMQLMSHLRRG